MRININALGLDLTASLESHLRDKLSQVERFLNPADESIHAEVEIGKTTNHHKHGEVFRAEIKLHSAGHDFYAEATEEDLYAAIDAVKNEITSEVKNFSKKQHTLLRRGGRKIKNILRSANPWNWRK